MPDFSQRSYEAELMDDLRSDEGEIRQNLKELEVVNKLLGGYSLILNTLTRLSLPHRFSVMDLGCGGGDMLRAIAVWAEKRGKEATLTGVDFNPVMIRYATEKSAAFANIHYRQAGVFDEELVKQKADVVTCSLFCHHFTNEELVRLIGRMYAMAHKAVVINDLHRHPFAYHAIDLLTRIFSKTEMVKHDGKLSVARAFVRKDLEKLMQEAGISAYTLRWRWAWRWELVIRKGPLSPGRRA